MKKVVLKNEIILKTTQNLLSELYLTGEVYEVDIKPYKKNRSLLQNGFYWEIMTIASNDIGMSKEELHHETIQIWFYIYP